MKIAVGCREIASDPVGTAGSKSVTDKYRSSCPITLSTHSSTGNIRLMSDEVRHCYSICRRSLQQLGIPVYSDHAIAAYFAYFANMRISHIFPHIMAFSKFRIFIYIFRIFIYA